MNWKEQYKSFLLILCCFLFLYFMPVEKESFSIAILAAFELLKWYAREHVILCLVPAFFIVGFIAVFISQASVVKYFGAKVEKWKAYLVASLSGTILAVCSCTVLPLFSSIHKRGAGLGPAIAFLYSGPAINILAMILTARILGFELGLARIIGAVTFSILIGLIMSIIYRKEEKEKAEAQLAVLEDVEARPFWQTTLHFFILIGILFFANWGKPANATEGFWYSMFDNQWYITSIFGIAFALSLTFIVKVKKLYVFIGIIFVIISAILFSHNPLIPFVASVIATTIVLFFSEDESNQWLGETWGFAKQIMPMLGAGIFISGFLLGSNNGSDGIIPKEWIISLVGGNSLFSNFFASIAGAFMHFATLTEIPILQGLLNSGMVKGHALALLLAGPGLSLPNMLVLLEIMETQKTVVYVSLVVAMATISGLIYGSLF